ncbi:MAG: hypothetical protein A2X94_11960 [Bdellovibrionales bacterium GWB1_55_8]|nr:MAG: hypothetical protein A2X94_11960 [Bdellovibrionales bacterium GWB1_55_8]
MKKSFVVTAVTAALFTVQAGAETTSATTSTATAPKSIRENISLNLGMLYHGPSLGHMTSSLQPDAEGKLDGAQLFESALTAAYKLDSLTKVSVAALFNYQPVMGQQVEFFNPYVKLSRNKIIDANGLTFNGGVRLYAPMTSKTRAQSFLTAVRFDESLGFQPVGSRWSAGIDGNIRAKFYNTDAAYATIDFWVGPHVDYQLNDKTSFAFSTDLVGQLARDVYSPDPYDLNAGVSYQILPNLNLNPSLTVRPTNLTLNSTQMNVFISADLL